MERARWLASVGAALALGVAGCGSTGSDPVTPTRTPRFLFAMRSVTGADGQFVAETSDPALLSKLRAQLALPASSRDLHVTGTIARGGAGYNLGWDWHFVPGSWDLVEISAEVCDGTPAMVQADPGAWIDQVGTFCPWTSYVQSEL